MFGALAGLMFYREAPAQGTGSHVFSVEFSPCSRLGPQGSGDAPDGESTAYTQNINDTNLTAVVFTFTFTDNFRLSALSPAGATFQVTSPDGEERSARAPPGGPTSVSIGFRPLNRAPDNTTLAALSKEEAASKALRRYPPSYNGTGDWTFLVTVERDYFSPVHPVRGSISWTSAARLEIYSLEVSELHR